MRNDHVAEPFVQQFDRVVTLKWRRNGQPRPYADCIREAELSFTGRNISTHPDRIVLVCGCDPTIERVKEFARLLIAPFQEGTSPDGLTSYLDHLEKIESVPGRSVWLVRIVEPYCD